MAGSTRSIAERSLHVLSRLMLVGLSLLAALRAAAALAAGPESAVTIRDPGKHVVDDAGVVDPATKQALEKLLEKLKQTTTDEVKVLTVTTLGGEDVFEFAQRHYQLWKLGQKKLGNGALIVVALKEHKIRIHTGYGLEERYPIPGADRCARGLGKIFSRRKIFRRHPLPNRGGNQQDRGRCQCHDRKARPTSGTSSRAVPAPWEC